MDFLASLDSLDPRVNLDLASLVLQDYQEYPVEKVSLDQRETLVSRAALVHPDDLDLMEVQDLKVSPVFLVFLEHVAHLDLPPLVHWVHQAHLDPPAQWDPQDSLEETERRGTRVLQV